MVKQLIVGDATHELATTRRILERLPEEHMAWKPHEKSMTLGGLATHLINLLNWQIAIFQYPEFDLSTVPLRRDALERRADVLEEFDVNVGKLEKLMCDACNEVTIESLGELKGWPLVQSFLAYHFTRRYPRWAQWLPRHVPRLLPAAAQPGKPLGAMLAKEKG